MSIWDDLLKKVGAIARNTVNSGVVKVKSDISKGIDDAVKNAAHKASMKRKEVKFESLPQTAEEMKAMKDKKLWIVVCEGDEKAYPAMKAAVDLWESLGSKVARGETMWNGKASENERNADTSAMLKKDADIRFNVIAGGSHMYTWSLAYNYEGIRDWLFSQSK